MRITLERSNLLKSLNHVHRVVERRNTIPILSNVLLRADGAALAMKATDLDLEITEETPANVEQAGATTVPAHLLYDIVRKLPDGAEVLLATTPDGNAMTVASGRSKFSLQCLPQSDFPDLTAGAFSHTFKLKATDLKMLIDRTQFAISTEETRYYLNGIFFHTIEADGDLKLRAVATDGHRLARADVKAPSGSEGMPGIIIPRKTVGELQKLVSRETGPFDPLVLSVTRFHAGQSYNVLADEVAISGTIRSGRDATRARALRRLEQVTDAVAAAYGIAAQVTVVRGEPPVVNDAAMVAVVSDAVNESLGANALIIAPGWEAADDFGFYSQKVPSVYFRLGVRDPEAAEAYPLHHPRMNVDERALALGASVLVASALQALERPLPDP